MTCTRPSNRWGCFSGPVRVEWIDDPDGQLAVTDPGMRRQKNRVGRLLEPFWFHDHVTGIRWECRAGDYIDGASIPPWASFIVACIGLLTLGLLFSPWVLMSPYNGPYRRASVPHDIACQQKWRAFWLVHSMFARAARADGAKWHLALALLMAVMLGGPKFRGRIQSVPAEQ